MLAVAMFLVVCTMPNEKRTKTYEVEWGKVPEMFCMAVALCCMAYVLVYGKTLDWFCSNEIQWGVALFLISLGTFILCSLRQGEKAYLPLKAFSYRNVWMSMLLFIVTMFFNSANSFVSLFAKLSTPINNQQSASLSVWAIVGCVVGLLLSLFLVVRKLRFSIIFSVAFLLMAASNVWLYFQYQTMGMFHNMVVPIILNFTGLLMLYSLVAAFGMKHLPSRYLSTFVFLMIWMRNAIAPVVGTSVYTNWLTHQQQAYVVRLSQNVDAENALASAIFTQTQRLAQAQGRNSTEAAQLATSSLKARVTLQATLVAMKDITGKTVLLLFCASAFVFLLPYHKGETT